MKLDMLISGTPSIELVRICKDLKGSARICEDLQGFEWTCGDLQGFERIGKDL